MKELYKHYKGGMYELLFHVTHSETLETMVVYKSCEDGRVWTRPLSMWGQWVNVGNEQVLRFTPISCASDKVNGDEG